MAIHFDSLQYSSQKEADILQSINIRYRRETEVVLPIPFVYWELYVIHVFRHGQCCGIIMCMQLHQHVKVFVFTLRL